MPVPQCTGDADRMARQPRLDLPGIPQHIVQRGGKRELQIPSGLGYGARDAGKVIPPGASLVFEVELLDIRNQH